MRGDGAKALAKAAALNRAITLIEKEGKEDEEEKENNGAEERKGIWRINRKRARQEVLRT